ncbi:ead/Ea22-like family protein [Yersinia aleksiciae]|uniref:ead/Ea22-like family protein n=1 Tax=Yersinia aleksiciae TaxID=263819 RepID=UPI001427A15E|nr:ead/Ea22-like family protein [Yersinia aleksiciae]MDA5496902.1 ead/Ea22-like family protein [Yersinia aleksiciae]NIK98716.1 hypothetical protein [Yersinia aleksiciae]WQC72369.1 ead/Ea22-like family protein [Yersinia aleksiciae]
MNNIEELKKAALEALGDECTVNMISADLFHVSTIGGDGIADCDSRQQAEFIASATPSVVLALIAQLEAAQKKVNELELADYKFWHSAACDNHQKVLKLEAELSAASEKNGWIERSDRMPDPNQQRRVCVFTPSSAADLRYRLVPANLFKAVCSSATHWYYVNDPVEGNADAE